MAVENYLDFVNGLDSAYLAADRLHVRDEDGVLQVAGQCVAGGFVWTPFGEAFRQQFSAVKGQVRRLPKKPVDPPAEPEPPAA